MHRLIVAALVIVPVLAVNGAAREHAANTAARTVWDSVYSVAQASRGESAYAKTCSRCHGPTLSGGDEVSPLVGGGFLGNWNGSSLADLHVRIKTTMPSDTVGIYDRQLVTDVMAFLLKANGFPAGSVDLPNDPEVMRDITIRASRP